MVNVIEASFDVSFDKPRSTRPVIVDVLQRRVGSQPATESKTQVAKGATMRAVIYTFQYDPDCFLHNLFPWGRDP